MLANSKYQTMRFIIKFSVLFFLSLVLLSTNIIAQQKTAPSIDTLAAREAMALRQKLSLNTVQQQKVYQAFKRYRITLQMHHRSGITTPQKKNAVRQLHTDYEKTMKDILTKDQFKNYELLVKAKSDSLNSHAQKRGVKVKSIKDN